MIRLLAVLGILCSGFAASEEMLNMKLPYRKEAAPCYQNLSKVNDAYREGFDGLRREASGNGAFEDRLQKLLEEHAQILVRGKQQSPKTEWREEDVYLCTLYDLFEGFFADEAERRIRSAEAGTIDDLLANLNSIPFESPKWKNGAKLQIVNTLKSKNGGRKS